MIVCLGWGSLIWDSRELELLDEWKSDGPKVPVEYLRQSRDGRLTLVIDDNSTPIQVLWAEMNHSNYEMAKENLRVREGNIKRRHVGCWQTNDKCPREIPDLDVWADLKGAQAVVWTALPPKFNDKEDTKPNLEEAVNYLQKLDGMTKNIAKNYICKTPKQIQTKYRKMFEQQFGWSCLE